MGVRLLAGHVLDRLAELPAGSVHCVVTSPPYWGLRDYKIPPQVWGGKPGCAHAAGAAIAATVLDPFLGAGTTALVADRLGRNCIGIELSPDYVAMGERRLRADAPLFLELAAE